MENALKSATSVSVSDQVTERPVLTGIVTGQVAGLIMAVVVMSVFAVFLGKSPFYPVQLIGSLVFGAEALQGFHLGAFLTGLVLHLAGPSLMWGLFFGFIAKSVSPRTMGAALVMGVIVGVISMAGPYALIPALMRIFQGVDYWNREVPMFWDWAAHLVFGASFSLFPVIERRLQKIA